MTIFAGDTISIMPEIQHRYYVAARVGYHVGWINFKHVKLVSLQTHGRRFLEETKPDIPVDRDGRIAQHQAKMKKPQPPQIAHQKAEVEDETQPSTPPVAIKRASIAREDVHRIINKLKSLGGLLSRR